jgi:glutaminase
MSAQQLRNWLARAGRGPRQAALAGAELTNEARSPSLSVSLPLSLARAQGREPQGGVVSFDAFCQFMAHKSGIIFRALCGGLVVPDFELFCRDLVSFFQRAREVEVAGRDFPEQAKFQDVDRGLFSVAVCTVDGQRFAYGDVDATFTMEGAVAPFSYLIALQELGVQGVHSRIGREPSGGRYNDIRFNNSNLPHNPLVSPGVLAVCSLIKPALSASERFQFVMETVLRSCGGKRHGAVSFNQQLYLAEKETSDHIMALGYLMKGMGCFGKEGERLSDFLELFFQLNNIETDTPTLATMACKRRRVSPHQPSASLTSATSRPHWRACTRQACSSTRESGRTPSACRPRAASAAASTWLCQT